MRSLFEAKKCNFLPFWNFCSLQKLAKMSKIQYFGFLDTPFAKIKKQRPLWFLKLVAPKLFCQKNSFIRALFVAKKCNFGHFETFAAILGNFPGLDEFFEVKSILSKHKAFRISKKIKIEKIMLDSHWSKVVSGHN